MARKKVTFEEVKADFQKVKGFLNVSADLKPVKGSSTDCCIVTGSSVEVVTLSSMKTGLNVVKFLVGVANTSDDDDDPDVGEASV